MAALGVEDEEELLARGPGGEFLQRIDQRAIVPAVEEPGVIRLAGVAVDRAGEMIALLRREPVGEEARFAECRHDGLLVRARVGIFDAGPGDHQRDRDLRQGRLRHHVLEDDEV